MSARKIVRCPALILVVAAMIAAVLPARVGAAPQGTGPDIAALRAARGPRDPAIPPPESVLGFYPGADFHLADWPAIGAYLRQLAASSNRMVLEQIGTSTEGQPLLLAIISSPQNLERRQRYREIAARMARAGGVDEAEAERLADEGRAIVWIGAGMHATEVAHGPHAPELAYRLVAGS